jgi:hypothetical protein
LSEKHYLAHSYHSTSIPSKVLGARASVVLNIVAHRHAGGAVLAIVIRLARILDVARRTAVLIVVTLALERAVQIIAGALAAPIGLLEALVHIFFARRSSETKLQMI